MLQIQAQPRKPPLRNFNSPLLSRVENANQCSHQIQFSRLGKILLKQARNTCLSCSRYKHEARPPRNSTASRVCGTERAPILGMLSTVAKKWHWWVDLGRFLIFHFLLHDVSLGFEPLRFPAFFSKENVHFTGRHSFVINSDLVIEKSTLTNTSRKI